MRTIRIYEPGPYAQGETIELSSAASQHVGVVLRMQPGDALTLFCGDNREFSATITAVNKKKVTVVIQDIQCINRESPRAIHRAYGAGYSKSSGIGCCFYHAFVHNALRRAS